MIINGQYVGGYHHTVDWKARDQNSDIKIQHNSKSDYPSTVGGYHHSVDCKARSNTK